jgi:hypothetical protein
MENRNFLSTAILVGMLTGHTKNGLNLINAPALAKDAGIEVSQSYEGHSDIPTVTVTVSQGKSISHSLQGMLHCSTAVIPPAMSSEMRFERCSMLLFHQPYPLLCSLILSDIFCKGSISPIIPSNMQYDYMW